MKITSMLIGLLIGILIGFLVSKQFGNAPCEDRYELKDTGIVGLSIRLDKKTGETKMIPVLQQTP